MGWRCTFLFLKSHEFVPRLTDSDIPPPLEFLMHSLRNPSISIRGAALSPPGRVSAERKNRREIRHRSLRRCGEWARSTWESRSLNATDPPSPVLPDCHAGHGVVWSSFFTASLADKRGFPGNLAFGFSTSTAATFVWDLTSGLHREMIKITVLLGHARLLSSFFSQRVYVNKYEP